MLFRRAEIRLSEIYLRMSSSRLPINEDTIRSLQAQLSLLEHSLGKPEAIPAQDMSQTLPAPMSRHNFAPLSRLGQFYIY